MEYIANLIGLIAVVIYLLGYQQKTRKRIILYNASSRALYILQYILLSAFAGAVLDVAGIISSVLAQKKDNFIIKKHLKLFVICVNVFIILSGFVVYENMYSLLPVIGVVLHTSALWITNEKRIRIVSLLGCPFWLIYNIVSGAYGSAVGDMFSIISILTAVFRYDMIKTQKKFSND